MAVKTLKKRKTKKAPASRQAAGEYDVVQMRFSWGLLSMFVFLYSLPIRAVARLLPWHPLHYWSRPGALLAYTLGLSVVGALIGWWGLRAAAEHGKGRDAARVGIFLNGTVFGILVLAVAGFSVYWRLLR